MSYYLGTGEDKDEAFYAAATVPFLPQNDDTDKAQDDAIDEVESPDDGLAEEESDIDKATETVDSDNAEADQTAEMISTISKNDVLPGSEEQSSKPILSETNITMHPGDDPIQVTAHFLFL